MAKADKEYTWRMQGMTHALEVAKKSGIDGLEKEVRIRGFLNMPTGMTVTQKDTFVEYVTRNLYATVTTAAAMALHDVFGFGRTRLQKWKADFDEKAENATNLDWAGEHFVTMEDYATYLNEQFQLSIDEERVAGCQSNYDNTNKDFRKASVERILDLLKNGGYQEAADFLDKKVR